MKSESYQPTRIRLESGYVTTLRIGGKPGRGMVVGITDPQAFTESISTMSEL